MKRHLAGLIALAAMTSGCFSVNSGTPFKKDSLSQIHKGRTTKQEAIAIFGQPQSTGRNSDGNEVLVYTHSDSEIRVSPWVFIPFVGIFAKSKGTSQFQSLQITVKDNIISDYIYLERASKIEASPIGGAEVTPVAPVTPQ